MKRFASIAIAAAATFLVAADPPGKSEPPIDAPTAFSLSPAKEPVPSLKYQLLPPLIERRPGNAAVLYNKCGSSELCGKSFHDTQDKLANWLAMPLGDLPLKEVREALAGQGTILDLLDLAARREHCDWELPIYERKVIALVLPEVQATRSFGRLLAMRARLQIRDGNYDDALHTLQTGFAMSRHVAEGPTLIHGLVGLAMTNVFAQVVRELMEQPNAPNLYWALTTLPRPLIDPRPGIEGESAMVYLSYPGLREVNKSPGLTPAAQDAIDALLTDLSQGGIIDTAENDAQGDRVKFVATAIKSYPQARERLLVRGRAADEVEKMPPLQVVVIDSLNQYEELRDKMFRWASVPFPQARAGLEEIETEVKNSRSEVGIPLAGLILPAVKKAYFAYSRTERQLAALRNLEALRLYAASHNGRLPAKLSEITEVPLALDPVTGKEFEYSLADGVASLLSPTPSVAVPNDMPPRYEIRIAK